MTTLHMRPEQPRLRLDGRYRLVEPLGQGGTSAVWRGLDERLSRPVAVKILRGARDHGFRNEAQALARLSHPHVAAVYDYGFSHHRHYIVMELVRGRPLAAALDRGPLPWPLVTRSCAQVASALAVAHARGLVHRDVTPTNIMLTPGGAKLIDFGISATAGDRETDPGGDLYGTPPYVAPERLRSQAVAPAIDVFALGVVLYRAVSGDLPWHAASPSELLVVQQSTDPADLPPVDGLPAEVGEACMRCLALDPAERPSAAELADMLTAASAADAVPARMFSTEPPPQPTTEALAFSKAFAASDLLAPTRLMPADRVRARSMWQRPWLRLAAAGLAPFAVAAVAAVATGLGPSEHPVSQAKPPAAVGPPAVTVPAAQAPAVQLPPARVAAGPPAPKSKPAKSEPAKSEPGTPAHPAKAHPSKTKGGN